MGYAVVYKASSLLHSGVKGMKWGVRRWQNYDGSYTPVGRIHYGIGDGHKGSSVAKKKKSEYDHSGVSLVLWKEIGKDVILSALAGGAIGTGFGIPIVGAMLGMAGGAAAAGQTISKHVMAQIGANKIEQTNEESGEVDKATGFYKKENREYSREEDTKLVNPHFKEFDENYSSNCFLCTLTYDLRRKGYAVSANGAIEGYMPEDVVRWYPKAKPHVDETPIEDLLDMDDDHNFNDSKYAANRKAMVQRNIKELESQPPGSRGMIGVDYFVTSKRFPFSRPRVSEIYGHAMAYEINEAGKLEIIDAQTNEIFTDPLRDYEIAWLFRNAVGFDYARLDNVEFDPTNIKEVAH